MRPIYPSRIAHRSNMLDSRLSNRTRTLNSANFLYPLLLSYLACLQTLAEPVTVSTPTSSTTATPGDSVTVTANKIDTSVNASSVTDEELATKRSNSSDSSRLLEDIPGVSLYGAGGISALPSIRGLADDRIRTQVDGMDLVAACPNHMNSPLSYINPTKVASVTVYAGITPVSVGGDSIGGTIQMKSAEPEFAPADKDSFSKEEIGAFYRSNGNARGYNGAIAWIGHNLNASYSISSAQSDNYRAGRNFKPRASGSENGKPIAGDVVASSAYADSVNQDVGLAWRYENHLFELKAGEQKLGFEGFPNQRMDMTYNKNTLVNARYSGRYGWGELEARAYRQRTHHEMDMGPDRYSYGTGMPMDTEATTEGASVQGSIALSPFDILRTGIEYQTYTLYDWWPGVGGTMGPNDFWNIDYGQRDKFDVFIEWEKTWNSAWLTQLGVRSDNVKTNAAAVQGYDNGLAALWGNDAAIFNTRDKRRVDHNEDFAALLRYTASALQLYEFGLAQKSHSPNLYQRYPWSTQPMAALMNNFVGDGNGYIGNIDLAPEIAYTASFTADWHDRARENWGVKATVYYTHVDDYIDAQRCDFGQCSAANATATESFVLLQYVNQTARLYGADMSANKLLAKFERVGSVTGTALINYVRGQNRTTGDNLYNIMPLNAKFGLTHALGDWSTTAELQLVKAKTQLSQVRNEIPTRGYGLFNLRGSYERNVVRFDIGIDNVFNRYYEPPLGGAYVGQGASMTTNGIAWGTTVPGMGRSINTAINFTF